MSLRFSTRSAPAVAVARQTRSSLIVSSLEGSYDLEARGRSAVAYVEALQAA